MPTLCKVVSAAKCMKCGRSPTFTIIGDLRLKECLRTLATIRYRPVARSSDALRSIYPRHRYFTSQPARNPSRPMNIKLTIAEEAQHDVALTSRPYRIDVASAVDK